MGSVRGQVLLLLLGGMLLVTGSVWLGVNSAGAAALTCVDCKCQEVEAWQNYQGRGSVRQAFDLDQTTTTTAWPNIRTAVVSCGGEWQKKEDRKGYIVDTQRAAFDCKRKNSPSGLIQADIDPNATVPADAKQVSLHKCKPRND